VRRVQPLTPRQRFGPEHEAHIAAANAIVPGGFTSFARWARVGAKPG